MGFPCNQFGTQEPDPEADILKFVQTKYDVAFPMFAKIEVNGDGACELYNWLKSAQSDGGDITWNFEKFLVDREGKVQRFGPGTTPEQMASHVAELL